ncbi:MAG TPA: SemiSWEET transporter [Usitatibacteraceae bacterium]
MIAPEVIGSIGACLTTFAFVPQVVRIWRTKSARDVSLPMYVIFCCGILCWLAYGLMLGAWPIIGANIVTLMLALAIIIMKLKFS